MSRPHTVTRGSHTDLTRLLTFVECRLCGSKEQDCRSYPVLVSSIAQAVDGRFPIGRILDRLKSRVQFKLGEASEDGLNGWGSSVVFHDAIVAVCHR